MARLFPQMFWRQMAGVDHHNRRQTSISSHHQIAGLQVLDLSRAVFGFDKRAARVAWWAKLCGRD